MEGPIEFNSLPKDLLFDIFSRLPLPTLCQLRCVCQKWLFFLNLDPEFTAFYHQKHKTSPTLVFAQQNHENSSTQLSFYYIDGTQLTRFSANFAHTSTSMLTCNGILCFINNSNAFLYDPITKLASYLPSSAQSGSTFSWALGQIGNVFKLLHFYTVETYDNFHYCQVKEVMCEILTIPTSEIGSDPQEGWRVWGRCPFDFLGRKNFAFVGGKIYWLTGEKKFNPDCIKIISFDLRTENFGLVSFSRKYSNRSVECLDLVEINEKLCLTDRLPWESTMNVWMMTEMEENPNPNPNLNPHPGVLPDQRSYVKDLCLNIENLVPIDIGVPPKPAREEEKELASTMWVRKYRIDLMGIDHHDVRILGHLSRNNCKDNEDEGEILIKFGGQRFGFYELESGRFRNVESEISVQGWDLKLLLIRQNLL